MTSEQLRTELKEAQSRADTLQREYHKCLGVIDFIKHLLETPEVPDAQP